jgi:MoaA/NifB/PqqE/SkfB family radical SAM enzyme
MGEYPKEKRYAPCKIWPSGRIYERALIERDIFSMLRTSVKTLKALIPKWVKDKVPAGIKTYLRPIYLSRTVVIDIVSACNLSCPSCPSGSNAKKNYGGKMSLEMFKKVLAKVAQEQPGTTVAIFNWTEPLLHPEIDKFLVAIKQYGLKSRISTNLNILRDADKVAAANPEGITISLSGFTQGVYAVGHRGGNIELVKENMRRLSAALRNAKASTDVTVYYHKYLHNLHEIDLMREYSESLGFSFGAGWAYYMPVERVQAYIEGTLPYSEREFVDNYFALNIRQAVDAAKPFRHEQCLFPTTQLTIDCRGNVQLCCAVYNSERFSAGSYLETPLNVIEKRLSTHPYCRECARYGLHIYASWHGHKIHSVYEEIAQENVRKKAFA